MEAYAEQPRRFLVFDVETPNAENDRISAIGIVLLEDGVVTRRFSTLIDPETWFDRFNIQLTGISPAAVEGEPTFPQFWHAVSPWFENSVLAAHNAPFDMRVLAKCLRHYGIAWKKTVPYLCTCQVGRSKTGRTCLPELPDHRLDTLCTALRIPLDHHRAGSDSEACAGILQHYIASGIDLREHIRRYDMEEIRTLPQTKSAAARKKRAKTDVPT